jgi:hypothetical protein
LNRNLKISASPELAKKSRNAATTAAATTAVFDASEHHLQSLNKPASGVKH